jgi:class 3 adenylate cyclase
MSVRLVCPACGSQRGADARFCPSCGSAFGDPASAESETRKIVTIVFLDVVSSTQLGEGLDSELLRRVMSRYFDEMRAVLERHGGVVEKFIGDAVMCVFGVPRVHEDDALRAVRAAVEMRDALARLNEEIGRSADVTLVTRTGLNTGEVIAGDLNHAQSFVAGDAVNVASHLEKAAAPGEILIADATHRLVRAAVVAEQVGALTLKGRGETVSAWRLLEVVPGAEGWTRQLDSPLVGREHELTTLEQIFEQAAAKQAPQLVTIMGAAGIGKSRLTGEFLSTLGDRCSVVAGRCLPYGERITFWPVVAALKESAQINDRDSPTAARKKLFARLPAGQDSELIRDRLAALLGLAPTMPGIQETFWAIRQVFEALAAEKPLVVVFDDIQWGESTFLDLLEYLADWIRSRSVIIVCLARSELFDVRPGWTTGKPNATLISLKPLTENETDDLIRNSLGRVELARPAMERIAEATEGNPLFVQETLRMLIDDGLLRRSEEGWSPTEDISRISIPPTVHALLTARLDRLASDERAVVDRASVVGRVFSWRAVAELTPPNEQAGLTGCLHSLIRKEFLQPEFSDATEEDSFRFAHILIRDAAYGALPKSVRADVHERFADWMETYATERAAEYEEIVGYHLEQAYRLLLELLPKTQRIDALGKRAAAILAAAGRRAYASGDMPAAVNLLSRATLLLDEEQRERVELSHQLAFALLETGDFATLHDVVAGTTKAVAASGDVGLEAHALILAQRVSMDTNPEGWAAEAETEATRAISVFEGLGDEHGLAEGWSLLGLVRVMNAQFGPAEEAWERAAAYAARAGVRRDELESLAWIPLVMWAGPTPVEQGLRRCFELLERSGGDKKATSSALMAQAAFEAMSGHAQEARDLIGRARSLLEEVALTVWLAGPLTQFAGWIELLSGEPVRAERELRWGYEKLHEIGESSWLSTVAAILAESVYAQDREQEAEELTLQSEESAGAEDAYSHALSRSVRARILARRGTADAALRLARESVALADTTDFLHLRWHARMSNVDVLQMVGNIPDARWVAQEAMRLAEQKGSVVGVDAARDLLETLEAGTQGSTEPVA